jgi:hypothetical protein
MTTWILEMVGLLVTTIGALIAFLHLHRTTREMAAFPEACAPLAKDRRLLMITMGLMSGWFIIQYIGLLIT